MPRQEVSPTKLEKEKRVESKELLDFDQKKLVLQEKTLLSQFRGKARNIVKALTLVTALSAAPEFMRAVEPEQELQKIEQIEPEKKIEKDFYKLTFDKSKKESHELVKNIEMVYLYVVNNGEAKSIVLSQKELKNNPQIEIDGYIAGVMAFTKDNTLVGLNWKNLKKVSVQSYEGEDYVSIGGLSVYPDQLQTKEYDKEIFQTLFDNLGHGYFLGEAPTNISYLGRAVNNRKNNTLNFYSLESARPYTINIKQKTFQKFKNIDIDPGQSRDNVVFSYRGNTFGEFSQIEKLDEKLQVIAHGIDNIKDISDNNFVNRVNIIDYKENNAFADQKKKQITFLIESLKGNSVKDIQLTTEHEVLHKYIYKEGFSQDMRIKEIFADLKGYTGEERQSLIQYGWLPFDGLNMDYENKQFFSFINEGNFFQTEKRHGHSHSNVYEFCTSFFHTLINIERLEENLDKPLIINTLDIETLKQVQKRGGEYRLSREEKIAILDNYSTVLKAMIDVVDNKDKVFLQDKLEHVEQINKSI